MIDCGAAHTTIYHCPLSSCGWEYTEPDWLTVRTPGPAIQVTGTMSMTEAAGEIGRRRLAVVEADLEAHLSTHTPLEWVTEVNRLNAELAAVRAAPAGSAPTPSSPAPPA